METLNTGFTVDIFMYLRQYLLHLIKCQLLTIVIWCAIDPVALVAGSGEDFQGMNPNQMAENLKKWKKYTQSHYFSPQSSVQLIECFYMTSRRPYWCSKTMERRPCWCPKPDLWELNLQP